MSHNTCPTCGHGATTKLLESTGVNTKVKRKSQKPTNRTKQDKVQNLAERIVKKCK